MKSIQIKVILIFLALGLVVISGLGYFTIDVLKNQGNTLDGNIEQVKFLMFSAMTIYSVITVILGIFISRVIIKPMSKLVKNAEKIAAGEDVEIKYLGDEKSNSEVDELVKAFSVMTTDLKENLNEVSRQKKQIETILQYMADGIIAFNMEGGVIQVNPAAKRLLRIMPQEIDFESIFKKFGVDINLEKIIYLEEWTSSEQRVQIGDSCINLFFAPFKDENEKPVGILVVVQDITEHVRLDEMRKEFVADVSHELKTPITSIMGYADTLLEGDYDKEMQDKFLNVIATEARRMAKLVTDLLTLSRYDNNQMQAEKTDFDLGELVKMCQEKLQVEIMKKNHKAECFVTANVPPVHADKSGIERVVLNIMTNSIKYTPEGGHIKIYVGFVYNDAYIKVIDDGFGIPEEDLTRIFERFYRVDKARTRELGGTGLGLAIAKEILDKNQGNIDIKSEKGKGTEVVIRIPTKAVNSNLK